MAKKASSYEGLAGQTVVQRESEVDSGRKAVVAQPQVYTETENYVIDLDPNEVAKWTPEETVNHFLDRVNLQYMTEPFLVNKITGKALMLLKEDHLREMGMTTLGDRLYLCDLLTLLKRKKMEAELNRPLWNGVTPGGGLSYYQGCGECCLHTLCGCCAPKTYWRVTGQGVFYRKEPACAAWCGEVSTEFMDYRFFKDMELKQTRLCCCFCTAHQLELYCDDHDTSSGATKASAAEAGGTNSFIPRILKHPEAPRVDTIIRNAWNRARLVAE